MEIEKEIKNLLSELFRLIGIEVKISVRKEDDLYKVEIDPGESAGLLIGSHGMTLSAISSFVAIAMKQKTNDWVNISLDISHWAEKQKQRLIEMAHQTAERARQTGEEQRLYNLNPTSRRVIHMALANESDIVTVSEGEGVDRCLIVKLKN